MTAKRKTAHVRRQIANQLFKFGGWNRVAESCRELGRLKKDKKTGVVLWVPQPKAMVLPSAEEGWCCLCCGAVAAAAAAAAAGASTIGEFPPTVRLSGGRGTSWSGNPRTVGHLGFPRYMCPPVVLSGCSVVQTFKKGVATRCYVQVDPSLPECDRRGVKC